jgi:penicillin-insensitive murein endopeptidase
MPHRLKILSVLVSALGIAGCLPWFGTMYPFFGSFGTTSLGLLSGAQTLPRQGEHFRLYHASSKAFAVPTLTAALVRAADTVAQSYPNAMLLIGDMSAKGGGRIPGHSSHRSGRDADIAFFVTDLWGNRQDGFPLVHFDRFGVGVKGREILRFDVGRNWALVEALLTDKDIEVQWIFVSNGLKALLLEWALLNNRDLNILERAASVLREPGDAAPHDDHFHVRIYCPRDTTGALCINANPIWPWIAPQEETTFPSKEEILKAALEGLE